MFLSRYFPNVTTKQKKSLLLNCHSMPKGCDSLLDSPFSNNCEKTIDCFRSFQELCLVQRLENVDNRRML